MKYKDETCTACGEAFTADDDVVVCPDCGSPHHRDCYMKLGRCANIALHSSGEKWRPKGTVNIERPRPAVSSNICPSCKFPNAAGVTTCAKCGAVLEPGSAAEHEREASGDPSAAYIDSEFAAMRDYLGFDPEEDMGGATLKEVSQFVGTNTLYYIPIFKHMKDVGTRISFNLSCLIFPYFYFANRKMWGWAVFSALISVILNIPTLLLKYADLFNSSSGAEKFVSAILDNKSSIESLASYFGMFGWVTSIAFCLFGNWLYYRYTMKSLKRIKAQSPEKKPSAETIMTIGGVKPVNIVFITLIMCGIGLAAIWTSLQILYK